MTTGVVIGKFLPPHRGHKYVIDTAIGDLDRVDVIVCARDDQPVDGPTRVKWLREIHPGATVHLTADDIPDAEPECTSQAWAARTIEVLGYRPDVAFTSEEYGPRFARYLGAEHVSIDPDRKRFPVSGTAVRTDPGSHWKYLEPCVRAWYASRICIVGAESTGTSTLAEALATHYDTVWVQEYGREFCEERAAGRHPLEWRPADFVAIARRQQAQEDAAARSCGPILICDTDALATSIWHERHLGTRSKELERLAARRRYTLYVLTGDEIPFVQDGTRDGEHLRGWMTERFRQELARRPEPSIEVHGSLGRRLEAAIRAVDTAIAAKALAGT